MTALSAARNTISRGGDLISVTAAATALPFQGGLVTLLAASGLAVAAGTAAAGAAIGVATKTPVASEVFDVQTGVFRFGNSSAADLVEKADIGLPCYIADDQTVALTDGGATRAKAGLIVDVDASGVWVKVGP